jgi:hypothetical protein
MGCRSALHPVRFLKTDCRIDFQGARFLRPTAAYPHSPPHPHPRPSVCGSSCPARMVSNHLFLDQLISSERAGRGRHLPRDLPGPKTGVPGRGGGSKRNRSLSKRTPSGAGAVPKNRLPPELPPRLPRHAKGPASSRLAAAYPRAGRILLM